MILEVMNFGWTKTRGKYSSKAPAFKNRYKTKTLQRTKLGRIGLDTPFDFYCKISAFILTNITLSTACSLLFLNGRFVGGTNKDENCRFFKTDFVGLQVTKMREYSNAQLAKSHENYIFQRQRLRKFSAQNYLKIRETGKYSILKRNFGPLCLHARTVK